MNPLGIFDVIAGALDCVAQAMGRKRQEEPRRHRILFGLLYGFILLAGLALIVWTIYSQYFDR